jgi:formylglycine-generating enzyme required for sulfatase activity
VRGNHVDSHVEAREPDLAIGVHVGRYVILERVGNGAMGVVYGAYDPELDRKIALKLLRGVGAGAAPLARARMMREAKAMARLSHPNVAAVHDVGVVDERVFLATEFLAGGTVREWLAGTQRGWREILSVFVAAGRGLAAAHAAGLVHRDFKPDNVLLDKDGRARVVDFGLARNVEAAEAESKSGGAGTLDIVHARGGDPVASEPPAPPRYNPNLTTGVDTSPSDKLDKLTRTGALMGTPAYMAPEQFLGEPTDERTDQFSFCVALYEALYGTRPFEGDTLLSLSMSVTGGHMRPSPKDREVPTWIRRAVLRGLNNNPADRYLNMLALIAALEDDPAIRGRRRLITGGVIALVAAIVLVAQQTVQHRREEVDKQIATRISEANEHARGARGGLAAARELRRKAYEAFDNLNRKGGESLWQEALPLGPNVDAELERAEQAFEAALVLDASREQLRNQLTDLLAEHLRVAEELHLGDRIQVISASLAKHDTDGSRRQRQAEPATVAFDGAPSGAEVSLERYLRDPVTNLRLGQARPAAARGENKLAPGSYRLTVRASGRADLLIPFEVAVGERVSLQLSAPAAASVPEGFVYVPAGTSWFGDADERLRIEFLDTVPLHRRKTEAFVIERHEVTYREWIEFLESLPARDQTAYAPDVSAITRGSLQLRRREEGWQLSFQPTVQRYTAVAGMPVSYIGRKIRARQDWLDFPVAGISSVDAERYEGWLRQSGRVPGARLCSELEWEHAARGADDRVFPHGDQLSPDDANFDLTYGRVNTAFGPDMAGSHPTSRSPFGVDDLAGNVLELTVSSVNPGEIVMRGGAYFFNSVTCRSTNRNPVPATFRDVTTGLRICASIGETNRGKTQNE